MKRRSELDEFEGGGEPVAESGSVGLGHRLFAESFEIGGACP
jgi:hypothetical protein